MCFNGNRAHIAIATGLNLFEVKRDSTDVQALRARIQNETRFIRDIIDELLLNRWLFNPDQQNRMEEVKWTSQLQQQSL